jgi:UDP-glucose 4-epimerase
MKIIILGSAGFLGRELSTLFHGSIRIKRSDCDLLNLESVEKLANEHFNSETVLINCAGKSWYNNSPDAFTDNLVMYYNLSKHFNKCYKVFLFSSGAEYGKAVSNAPDMNMNPFEINDNYYGMSKAFITKDCRKFNNVFNLRIFGCFGLTEPDKKFIRSNILKYIKKENMLIDADRSFDYFYVEDVCRVIIYLINNDIKEHEMNLTYSDKIKLSQIAEIINSLNDYKVEIKCLKAGNDYTGEPKILQDMSLEFVGLTEGIKRVYQTLK